MTPKPDRYPVTDTERVALEMLAAAAATAAQRLNSSLLVATDRALRALAEGRVERAREVLADYVRGVEMDARIEEGR